MVGMQGISSGHFGLTAFPSGRFTAEQTDLQNVTEISIGIDGGSSGIIYVDDLQLWP
jgi:hypothetical protein